MSQGHLPRSYAGGVEPEDVQPGFYFVCFISRFFSNKRLSKIPLLLFVSSCLCYVYIEFVVLKEFHVSCGVFRGLGSRSGVLQSRHWKPQPSGLEKRFLSLLFFCNSQAARGELGNLLGLVIKIH